MLLIPIYPTDEDFKIGGPLLPFDDNNKIITTLGLSFTHSHPTFIIQTLHHNTVYAHIHLSLTSFSISDTYQPAIWAIEKVQKSKKNSGPYYRLYL